MLKGNERSDAKREEGNKGLTWCNCNRVNQNGKFFSREDLCTIQFDLDSEIAGRLQDFAK